MMGSSYPLFMTLALFGMLSSIIMFLKFGELTPFISCFPSFVFIVASWISNVNLEGLMGLHSFVTLSALKVFFLYILLSEVMFFFAMFWYYLDVTLVPSEELGQVWPPKGVELVNPLGVPILNTVILLSSAVSLSCSQTQYKGSQPTKSGWLLVTIILGMLFLLVQGAEYYTSSFTFSDSAYGSIFYMLTGFHGFHVFLGVLFLSMVLARFQKNHFSYTRALAFEFATLYWHFVDFVWLLVYLMVYYWTQ